MLSNAEYRKTLVKNSAQIASNNFDNVSKNCCKEPQYNNTKTNSDSIDDSIESKLEKNRHYSSSFIPVYIFVHDHRVFKLRNFNKR